MLPSSLIDDEVQRNKGKQITFSIDEILKPSFGSRNPKSIITNDAQPLDMRIEIDKVNYATPGAETMHAQITSGTSSPSPTSADELSNSSPRSSRGSSLAKHSSSSRESIICEYNCIDEEINKLARKHGFSDCKNALSTHGNFHVITSNPYYSNALNHIYNFDVCAFEKHLYNRCEPMSQFLNPYLASYQHFLTKQGYTLQSPDFDSALKNNTTVNTKEEILKSKQPTIPFETNTKIKKKIAGRRSYLALVDKPDIADVSSSDQKVEKSTPEKITVVKSDRNSSTEGHDSTSDEKQKDPLHWPAWVYCTRYSDRPSSGPRYRKPRTRSNSESDKRPRIAFSTLQLHRLKREFDDCPYLSETRRQALARELGLNESQVKIWFQNKRAKLKKSSGSKNLLALRLMQEGLYNHSTIVVDSDDSKSDQRYDAVKR